MKDLDHETFNMMQKNSEICKLCGFKLNGGLDVSDCINSECKHFIKAEKDLKPYYESKISIQYEEYINRMVKKGAKDRILNKEKWLNQLTQMDKFEKDKQEKIDKKEKNLLHKTLENIGISERDEALYKFYVKMCKKDNEKPKTYDEWLNDKYKEKEGL